MIKGTESATGTNEVCDPGSCSDLHSVVASAPTKRTDFPVGRDCMVAVS